MGDKEDSHGFGDVWRMDDSNQNGGHTCTKTATENPNNPKLKGSMISTRSTNNEDEGWLCELCNTNFTKKNDKLLECDYCSKHVCIQCLDMTVTCYNQLSSRVDIKWFCPMCKETVEKNLKADRQIEEKCRLFLKTVEDRLKMLEVRADNFVTRDEVQDIIKNTCSNVENPNNVHETKHNTDTNVSELVIREMSERKKRKNNTIMFRVPEPTTNVKLDRINADLRVVKEIGAHIDVNIKDDDIVRVIRLGKKVDNNNSEGENTHITRSRPLLITFSNESVKKTLFQNVSKLRDITGELAAVSVDHDMTPKEREETKAMVEEAKKKEESSSGKFIFRVRGPPWNRYIKKMIKEK